MQDLERQTAANASLMQKSSERAGTYHMYARTTFSYVSMFWFKITYYSIFILEDWGHLCRG
jgi:hypothetical protein